MMQFTKALALCATIIPVLGSQPDGNGKLPKIELQGVDKDVAYYCDEGDCNTIMHTMIGYPWATIPYTSATLTVTDIVKHGQGSSKTTLYGVTNWSGPAETETAKNPEDGGWYGHWSTICTTSHASDHTTLAYHSPPDYTVITRTTTAKPSTKPAEYPGHSTTRSKKPCKSSSKTPVPYHSTSTKVYSPPAYSSVSSFKTSCTKVKTSSTPVPVYSKASSKKCTKTKTSSIQVPAYSTSTKKCTKSKTSSTPVPVYSTPETTPTPYTPTAKTKTIVYTKPCSVCSKGTTIKTKTLTATSCVTYPPSYITKTISATTTVSATHSSLTPYVLTSTKCRTFTVPESKSWIWPSHHTTPAAYTTSTVWAYSVGHHDCPKSKPCHKRDGGEYTYSIPVSTTSCSVENSSSAPSVYWPTTTESTWSESTTSSAVETPTPYVSAYTTICPSSSTSASSTWVSSVSSSWVAPPPYVTPSNSTVPTYTPPSNATASMKPFTPISNGAISAKCVGREYVTALIIASLAALML